MNNLYLNCISYMQFELLSFQMYAWFHQHHLAFYHKNEKYLENDI